MKKILLSLALAATVMPALATDYTDDLTVSVNGVTFPTQTTKISVNKRADGAYDFLLKDFTFSGLNIGDINLDSVPGVEQDGNVYLAATHDVNVNLMGIPLTLPVTLRGMLFDNSSKLYASMDINVQMMHQSVTVSFGNAGYQLPNSGFDAFHTETLYEPKYSDDYSSVLGWTDNVLKTASVPNAWHSFMDATGWGYDDSGNYGNQLALVYMASAATNPHIYMSDEVDPELSAGGHSAKIIARNAFIAIANGTMTTGRMNTGSAMAADVANHAYLDLDSTGTDANNDPFYTVMNGRPDSVAVVLKYNQATPNAEHPYATVSAAITDGTYYQEPDTNVYNNVYALARNNKIEATGNGWKRVVIPFTVQNANVNSKAIMVTISTNADAGQGSDGDSILVDNINFVYNVPQNVKIDWGTGTSISADNINVKWDGALDARIVKDIKQVGDSVVATVTVYNGDLTKQAAQETHTYPAATVDGISSVKADVNSSKVVEIYDLSGRRVNSMVNGNVYIVKTADNKTVKIAK